MLLSIIVPVYNAQRYLPSCMNMLHQQSIQDKEVIFVDDGSTDDSGKICDQFAAQYAYVRVIHTQNRGVGSARQTGWEKAHGKYVAWMDSDDRMDADYLEHMVSAAEEQHADLIISDFWVENEHETKYFKQQPASLSPHAIQWELFNGLLGCCWNKLFRRIDGVQFIEGLNYCEDKLFVCNYLNKATTILYLPIAGYYYNVANSASIIASGATGKLEQQYYHFLEEVKKINWIENKSKIITNATLDIAYKLLRSKNYSTIGIQQLLHQYTFAEIWRSTIPLSQKLLITQTKLLPQITHSLFAYVISIAH